jgi:hypothetical protein
MGLEIRAGVAPIDTTSSVIFALASPLDHPRMRQARQWVDKIIAAAPDHCVAIEFGRNLSLLSELQRAMMKVHGGTMPPAVQAATFGELRGHSLVIFAQPTATPSGIYSFAGAKGASMSITDSDLSSLGLNTVTDERTALTLIAWFLRAGKFLRVYLIATTTGGSLAAFATRLAKLTQCLVSWSDTPIEFTIAANGDVVAHIGPAGAVVQGKTHVKQDPVALQSAPNTFLPGAESMVGWTVP